MVKIELFSHYHHFQKHAPESGDKYIRCYNDIFVTKRDQIRANDIALLIEPRFIQPAVYTFIEQHYFEFKYIFTHDSYLLNNLPNAKRIIWGGVWGSSDMPKANKISIVASDKANNYWRKERVILAKILSDSEYVGRVDTFGTFNGGPRADTLSIYGPYKFSIAMENSVDTWWMTEKLMNCFANKTVPIYLGAPMAEVLFNPEGIIFAESINQILDIVENLDIEKEYESRMQAINENYELVKEYAVFEDWFYKEYGELLEGMTCNYL